MSATIEDRLKESYRPACHDDAWVDELFADQLEAAKEEKDWYGPVCQKCPYFVDGEKTGNTIKKLVEQTDDDDPAQADDVSGEMKLMKWVEVPLIQCMRSEATECIADSFIVTAFVYSLIVQEKQAMEYMRERIQARQQAHKQTQNNSKRNRKLITSKRRRR